MPSQPAQHGADPLCDALEHDSLDGAVAASPEVRHQHEGDIALAESDWNAAGRPITGLHHYGLELRQLLRLEMGRGSWNGEVIFRQLSRPKQHRAALGRKDPEPHEIVGNLDRKSIGESLVPGGERDGIGLTVLDRENGNERFAPPGGEQFVGRLLQRLAHKGRLSGRSYALWCEAPSPIQGGSCNPGPGYFVPCPERRVASCPLFCRSLFVCSCPEQACYTPSPY
jgi:hypothetical protein